jgi:3-oxoacyl-[acyl-carrier-protein] synthase-1
VTRAARALAMSDFTLVTALGKGRAQTVSALRENRSGLASCTFDALPFPTYVGEVAGLDNAPLQGEFYDFDCRNNRLAAMALRQDKFAESVAAARDRYGAGRIGLFLGTSTSGLLQAETAYRHRDPVTGQLPADFNYANTQNTYSLARFLRMLLGLTGPAFVVSTACAATSKVFADAARMIAAGICDAAIVGGADSLCATTLCGFHSLGVMAEPPCRPFDATRSGISIGEAAGFVLLERISETHDPDTVLFLGAGESSDAYHMSSPHPQGSGARLAMQRALAAAGVKPEAVDYVNLHGTATLAGDEAEERAMFDLFGIATKCSSTKGFTGHTLGASGVVEALICALAIQNGFLPGSRHTINVDPAFRCYYVRETEDARPKVVITNSFGFGGVNCSLVLGSQSSVKEAVLF